MDGKNKKRKLCDTEDEVEEDHSNGEPSTAYNKIKLCDSGDDEEEDDSNGEPSTTHNKIKLRDSGDDEEEDDYPGGPCSSHKKSVAYFYCETHSLHVCKDCTVIDHPTTKCTIISLKEFIERGKADNNRNASLTVFDINDTLNALDEFVKKRKNTIKEAKKAIKEAEKMIEKGKEKKTQIEAAKENLQNAKTKESLAKISNDINTTSTNVTTWKNDICTEFKVTLFDDESSAPTNILKGLKSDRTIYITTTINDKEATAKLESTDEKLNMHIFQHETSHKEAITFKYEDVLSHLQARPPTLIFLDLACNDTPKGRIYIRLEPELHDFIKHIPALFTAENGSSILGNTRKDISNYFHLEIKIEKTVDGIASRNAEGIRINGGEVFCYCQGNSIILMCIHAYDPGFNDYNSNYAKIGHVESGFSVVSDCKNFRNPNILTISDCGLVLEM